jgi:GAF domain-containing protein
MPQNVETTRAKGATSVTAEAYPDPLEELDPASWSTLDRLGRVLHVKEADLQATLDAIARTAVETVDNAEYAGVNLLDRGRFVPQAVAGQPPLTLDALQQETGTGPCIDCSRDQVTLRVDDVATDPRWPAYAELATSLGVASMLCVPMSIDEQCLGSVSLYGIAPDGFSGHHERLANLFATHAALVLADAQRTQQLRQALANRDVIGQAKGILMERHHITADAAFVLLRERSQQTNRKLVVVAGELTETGHLG